jgi:23S rRNA pseudouridine955/2504/2580 synthase
MVSATSRPREAIVEDDRNGQRLDNFLARELGSVPRSLVYRLIRTGQVRVNGGRARPMRKLAAGDRVRIPPVRVDSPPSSRLPAARVDQARRSIVHRCKEFLVVDKPSGLASQRGSGLAFGLNDLIAAIEPGALPVHRLDRETSGLMIFALGSANARALQREFSENRIGKRYLALLDAPLKQDRVVVDEPLKKIRDASGQRRVIVAADGRPARSEFRRLRRLGRREFVEVRIETGRTHQIRAHAAWLNAPVAGDDRYNPGSPPAGLERLFLHAASLRLSWPRDQVFSAPLPEDLEQVLDALS